MINLTTGLIQEIRSLSIGHAVYGFGMTQSFFFATPHSDSHHVVTQIFLYFLSCQRSMFKLLQFTILELFSCDVITWRLCPWQYQCKINPPRHDSSAGSALTSPACRCDPEASCATTAIVVSDVGQSSAAGGPQWGSEPGLSGSEGERGRSLYNANSFECCNKV